MNVISKPRSNTIDCADQNKVIFALHCAIRNSPREVTELRKLQKLLIKPFEKGQNTKILNFELEYKGVRGLLYDPQFNLMQKMLKTGDKIKIVIFVYLDNMYTCKHLTTVLHSLKLISLPVKTENLGLVITSHVHYSLDYDWSSCLRSSYDLLNCPKYGCQTLQILTQHNATNDFTNTVRVRYDDEDGDYELRKLSRFEDFVNKKLNFQQIQDQDASFYHSHLFNHLQDIYLHYYGLEYDDLRHNLDVWLSLFSKIKSTAEWREAEYQYHYTDNRKNSHFELDKVTYEYKEFAEERFRQFAKTWRYAKLFSTLEYDEVFYSHLFLKMSGRNDKPSIRIRKALLQLVVQAETIAVEWKTTAICPLACNAQVSAKFDFIKTCGSDASNITFSGSQLEGIKAYTSARKVLGLLYWYGVHRTFNTIKMEYQTAIQSEITGPKEDYTYSILSTLIFNTVETIFNRTIARLEFRQPLSITVNTAVDSFLQDTIEWFEKFPSISNDTKLWEDIDDWLAIKRNYIPTGDFYAVTMIFGAMTPTRMFQSQFSGQMVALMSEFREKLLNTAVQRLAESKMGHVDAAVAGLDRAFLGAVKNLHDNMDSEQWLVYRGQQFYYLLRFQENFLGFEDFVWSVQLLFDINHVALPMEPKRELDAVQTEFKVYETRLKQYVQRPLVTEQNWGRRMEKTREFMFKNSAATMPSLINEGVAWIECQEKQCRNFEWVPLILLIFVIFLRF